MRVFVTGTGRCGSVTFAKACKFITNYTSSHESCSNLTYPDDHIEVNPQFCFSLSKLAIKYPNSIGIHLVRDRRTCIPSLAAQGHGKVMGWYHNLRPTIVSSPDVMEVATRYWEDVNLCIRCQLRYQYNPDQQLTVRLENIVNDFRKFWDLIGAEGDLESALQTLSKKHNTRLERNEPPWTLEQY